MPVLLLAMILVPLLGGVLLGLVPEHHERLARPFTVLITAAVLALACAAWLSYDPSAPGWHLEYTHEWVPGLGTSLHLGVDGTALALVALTALLTLVATLASRGIDLMPRRYFTLLMLLEAGLIGVFVALDLILFYVFWEVVLIPMFFLIGIWGGERRRYAAVKFFIYTLAGSLAMLGGMIALYLATGAQTFDMVGLSGPARELPATLQTAIFSAFAVALAIKVPIVPFHTWLPDAHVEAPTAVSVLLAGVLLKMGSYGFLRLGPNLLADGFEALAPLIALLGAVSIVWGAAVALMQSDLKRLVAYSSVSHMGYVMLGIASGTTAGILGANVQMVSHGLIAGMLFLLVGALYERAHTREIDAFGGIAKATPVLAGTLIFAAFASAGLPGLSGFVGEFLVVLGSIERYPAQAVTAAAGVVVTVTYLLWMVRRVAFGALNEARADMPEIQPHEIGALAPLAVATVLVGTAPQLIVDVLGPASLSATAILSR